MTFMQTYADAQTNTEILSPSTGKSIYIWQVILNAPDSAEIKFSTSEQDIAKIEGSGDMSSSGVDKQGAVNEAVCLTCGANTTVKILWDEV